VELCNIVNKKVNFLTYETSHINVNPFLCLHDHSAYTFLVKRTLGRQTKG